MTLALLLAILPVLLWDSPGAPPPGYQDIAIPSAAAGNAPVSVKFHPVDPSTLQKLPVPQVQFRMNQGSATRAPWIDSNGWQFHRAPDKAYLYEVDAKAAPLAAAEAFAFGVRAYVRTDAAGAAAMAPMLEFLKDHDRTRLPARANIAFVDDGSDRAGEVMNLMIRRNLLFRTLSAGGGPVDLTVRLGSPDYPAEAAANPSELAYRIRKDLGDEKRLVRVYGSDVVIARLTGDAKRSRLHLLNYSGSSRPVEGIRVRVLGRYTRVAPSVFSAPSAKLLDVETGREATEFTLPQLGVYAIIDLFR